MKYLKSLFIATLISLAICWPSIDVSNSDDQRLELTFGDATADPSKAGRFDLKITSQWSFPGNSYTAGVICAVKDEAGDFTPNTEYSGFSIGMACSESGGCKNSGEPFKIDSSDGIVNHTGSQIDFIPTTNNDMNPILDQSQTGLGFALIPFIFSGSIEYDEATKTSKNYPSSSQYLI